MEALAIYLLKSTLVSGVFYLLYRFLLRRESFFAINRFYLLFSVLFAYLFPFIKINLNTNTVEPEVINTINTVVNQFNFVDEIPFRQEEAYSSTDNHYQWWILPLAIISAVFLFRFLKNLFQLYKTIHANEKITQAKFTLVLFNQSQAFSFFRYIFISPFVWNSPKGKSIVAHELSHTKHRHSLDRLFIETMLIFFWMNPFIYLYRKALEEVHEYQADADATEKTSVKEYFNLVLQQSSAHNYSPLMSPFSYKLIKKRIKMANYKSHPVIKFRLIIPLLIGIAILTTSAINFRKLQSNSVEHELVGEIDNMSVNTFVLPIQNGNISTGWGYSIHPILMVRKFHEGIDITAPLNTPVIASQSGTVTLVRSDKKGYGKRIELSHSNNQKTLYAHLNNFNVKEGQEVKQGDIIGYVGNSGASTAPHLHFEIHKDGTKTNPQALLGIELESKNRVVESNVFKSPIKKEELTKISSGYGMRKHPITKEMKKHNGVDYVAPLNTNVLAIGDGVIRKVNNDFIEGKGYGRFIIIDHKNGYSSLYSQLNEYKVKEGQKVKAGDVIGLLGSSGMSTGPHLHLEIKKDGQFIDPESVIEK
ncbi:peptidoglycan DD-metalloendopeptidase family protein [Carboxylicivirga sp. RSCT41]|uniref:peptidoglycan DD-metalloendopeptidase family protein n=1 Tax=Carboxylicivirga agarovorans TaxID=3417570 RepID=UPI003D34C573